MNQTTQPLTSLLPRAGEIAGWTLMSGPATYESSHLFEYMDGAAEIPKSYGFKSLASAKYQNGDTVLEAAVYDMGAAVDAFGYYSARVFLEHSPRSKERIVQLDHPAHIYSTVGILTFWKDRYTIILQPDNGKPDDETLLKFAKLVSSRITAKGSPPAMLHHLPAAGQVADTARYIRGKAAFDATVMFTAKDVFGMSSGPVVVAAEYSLSATDSTLALVKYPDAAAAKLAVAHLRTLMSTAKARIYESTIAGAFECLSIGRAKGVGAVAKDSFLLLAVGAHDPLIVDAGLKRLIKAMGTKK